MQVREAARAAAEQQQARREVAQLAQTHAPPTLQQRSAERPGINSYAGMNPYWPPPNSPESGACVLYSHHRGQIGNWECNTVVYFRPHS